MGLVLIFHISSLPWYEISSNAYVRMQPKLSAVVGKKKLTQKILSNKLVTTVTRLLTTQKVKNFN